MSKQAETSDKEALEVFKLLFDLGETKAWYKSLVISNFWGEKLMIWIEIAQLFVFCFAANYEVWPLHWQGMINDSLISAIFAADFGTLFYDDIIDDSTTRVIYSYLWLIVSGSLISIYFLIKFIIPLPVLWRIWNERYYFILAHLLYLPIALGLLPAAFCQYDNCWDTSAVSQLIMSILSFCVTVLFLLGMPIYMGFYIQKHLITDDPEAHEDFIRQKEMEYVLQISHAWLTERQYLFSSYRRNRLRVYHRPIYQLFVLSLVIVHGILNTHQGTKMMVLTLICAVFSLYTTIFPVYRCMSSSFLYFLGLWIISANMFLGYLKAANYDAEALVDSNMTSLMIAVNVTSAILLVFLMGVFILFKFKWPVHLKTVKNLALGYRFLLADLRNSQKMILMLRAKSNYQFVKAEPINGMIKILREHYTLLYNENHPLQYTALEQLDILDFLKQKVTMQTLLPCKRLEESYGLLVSVVNRRWKEQILMSPVKRRILLKLYILKMFLGRFNTTPFNSGSTFNYVGKGYGKRQIGIDDLEIEKLWLKDLKQKGFDSGDENFNSPNIMFSPANADNNAWLVINIEKAQEANNLDWLTNLTEKALELDAKEAKELLIEIWNERGEKNLHEDLRARLYQQP